MIDPSLIAEMPTGTMPVGSSFSKGNYLKLWGNHVTMNINPLIHSNIIQSHYWKVNLSELKSYHEVVDEIYYQVKHLEPWEKGSRKSGPGTGGGVRGVGSGGIVSSAYSLMYKLFTMKITRKQLKSLIVHPDSPYIRGVGFLFIRYVRFYNTRYCIQPDEWWNWYREFLDDPEEIDVQCRGGCIMTIGQFLMSLLTDLDWFSTKLPRIPVPAHKVIEQNIKTYKAEKSNTAEDDKNCTDEKVDHWASNSDRPRERDRSRSKDRKKPKKSRHYDEDDSGYYSRKHKHKHSHYDRDSSYSKDSRRSRDYLRKERYRDRDY